MTITRKNDLHNINFLLNNGSDSTFVKIIQKAQILGTATKLFHKHIDEELAKHCNVIEVTKTTLHLLVDNSSWATILHYKIPEIVKSLATKSEFSNITNIKYQIKKG
jgi:hypothetical protein